MYNLITAEYPATSKGSQNNYTGYADRRKQKKVQNISFLVLKSCCTITSFPGIHLDIIIPTIFIGEGCTSFYIPVVEGWSSSHRICISANTIFFTIFIGEGWSRTHIRFGGVSLVFFNILI